MELSTPKFEILTDLTPVFDEKSLWRYLGYPRGATPDERIRQTVAQQQASLPELLSPRGVAGLFSGSACFDADFALYDREVILCVVTIGDKLESRAAEYAASGEVSSGFVLDTLGSVYAEGLAEAAYRNFKQQAAQDGLKVGCRISPGYGSWALERQKDIFAVLPVEQIGIKLTPGLMMAPRKSVSFAVERSTEPLQLREGEQCVHCTARDCRFRHA